MLRIKTFAIYEPHREAQHKVNMLTTSKTWHQATANVRDPLFWEVESEIKQIIDLEILEMEEAYK